MTAPVYVNAGVPDADGFDTSATPALPGSRVNGNLLIALITANGTGNARTFTFPAGWTTIGTALSGVHGNSWLAWRLVNGSEVAPNITLSGADSLQAQIFQYSGVFGANPIGSVSRTAVATSTVNVTDPGVTVARNNSRVAVFLCGNSSGGSTLSTPSGYTLNNTGTPSFANINAYSQTTPNVSGDHSTAVASTASDARGNWMAWSVEIASENANANPTVSTSAAITYYEGDAAAVIAADMVVADPDGGNLASAVVSITSNLVAAQDVLGFTNQNGITGSYNSGTGVLTLTGSATIANYQTALRSITYANTGEPATTSIRTVSFQVNDGAANSNTDTATVNVQGIVPGSTLTTTPGAGSTTVPPYWAIEIEIWAGGQAGDQLAAVHGNVGLLTTCSTFGLTANPASAFFGQGPFYYGRQSGLPGTATGGDVNLPGQRGGTGGKVAGGDGGIAATISPNQGGNAPFGGLGGAALPPTTGTISGNDGAAPGGGGSGIRSAGFGISFGGWFAFYSAGGTAGSYSKIRFVRGEIGAPAFGSTINYNIGAGGARTPFSPPNGITSGAGGNGGIRVTVFGFDSLEPDEGGDSDTGDEPVDLGAGSVEIISPNTPPRERDTLRAEYQGDDPDSSTGVGTNVSFRWLADGVAISGATGTSFVLTGSEIGKLITVEATYTDAKGFRDVTTSEPTAAVLVRSLPLDDLDMADVYAAWSVKLLRRDYTGPLVRLFHGSTNAEQDFFAVLGSEVLDHDAILAWRVSEGREFTDTCYATIYDQTGHERHITGLNVAHAFAPRYSSYGDTVIKEPPYTLPSGYPAPLFDGSREFTRLALVGPTSMLGFFAVVLRDDSEPGRVFRWDYTGDTAQEVGFRLTTTAAADWTDNAAAFYGHGVTAGASPRAIATGPYAENDDDAVIWEGELSTTRRAIRRNGVTQPLAVNVGTTFTPIASGKLVVGPNTSTTNKTSMMAELVIFNNDIHAALGPLRTAAAQSFLLGPVSTPEADDLVCNFTDDTGWSEAIITIDIALAAHFSDDNGWTEAEISIALAYQAKFTDDAGWSEATPTIVVFEPPAPVQTVVVILGAG